MSDYGNDEIRRITPAGLVTTFAGAAGIPGSADGTGTAARFNLPTGIEADSLGNLYVADSGNQDVRKITPGGEVSVFAGIPGNPGTTDGGPGVAQFNSPYGIAVDSGGNVYVSDLRKQTIRKITPARVTSTLAGHTGIAGAFDGTGSGAYFFQPRGIAVTASGYVFVADSGNDAIRMITPAGVVTTLAGSFGAVGLVDGNGTNARFRSPSGITLAGNGDLIGGDTGNAVVRRITVAGGPSAGYADGAGSAALFSGPGGVAVDSSGNVFVADTQNEVIRKVDPSGVVTTFAGAPGIAGTQNGTGGAARFSSPSGIAVDASGNLFIADTGNFVIRKITPAAVVTTFVGSVGNPGGKDGTGSAATFQGPAGVAVDPLVNIFVSDTAGQTIRKITSSGVVKTLAGNYGQLGDVDGTGSSALFTNPRGLASDSLGNIYVADSGNDSVRKISSSGSVKTVWGPQPARVGSTDAIGRNARFNAPTGVAIKGNTMFITDAYNCTVRKVDLSAMTTTTTIAGLPGYVGHTDGTGGDARFNVPLGLAVGSNGVVYVADTGNNAIRISSPGPISPPTNLSTRLNVQSGENVLIGGFIVRGSDLKNVIIRGIGPSLAGAGIQNFLGDPTVELRGVAGNLIASNNNWKTNDQTNKSQQTAVQTTGLAPSNDLESAILASLPAGNYTAIMRGNGASTGIGLIQVYDLNVTDDSVLSNISTRGFVDTGNNVVIGGVIIGQTGSNQVLIRALGPTLASFGVSNVLSDPVLDLYNSNGTLLASNNNWKDSQEAAIAATGNAPPNNAESALLVTLTPGNYTAIVHNGGTGVALFDFFTLQ